MKTMRLMRVVQGVSLGLSLVISSSSLAQTTGSPSNSIIPVVTLRATDPVAVYPGNPGVFTVFRWGNPAPALNVWYQIDGTAINGVDYQTIGHWAYIPSGVASADIIINPLPGAASLTKTVVLTLTNSPLMGPVGGSMPVNYIIGSPSRDMVYITSGPATNIPPTVSIAYPPGGAVFYTPGNIPIVACAKDIDGFVRSVEFFADNVSLGTVTNPVSVLPAVDSTWLPVPPMPPYRPFVFVWSNAPAGTNLVLTAKATDNLGASATSSPVSITIHPGPPPPPPPPPNLPPVARITSPPNNSVFRAPINLPIFAYAADQDGWVTGVEFFAGTNDLGPGHRVTPPTGTAPVPSPISLTNFWGFVWSNPPPSSSPYALTAVATDNGGASATSAVVNVSILEELPPPPVTNLVGIVATDPIAIEGTNCWPWLGLAASTPTWANWTASTAVCRYFTNCGPKDALFTVRRCGLTNSDLTVTYAVGGTATNGVDYVTLPGTVTIPAGQRAALIPIVPLDDGPPDITSTVILKLTPSADYMVDPQHGVAAALILDGPMRPPLASVLPDRCFRINSTGPDGAWFRIECTTDLHNWTPLCTNQIFGGSLDFIDPGTQAGRLRFYRAVAEANAP